MGKRLDEKILKPEEVTIRSDLKTWAGGPQGGGASAGTGLEISYTINLDRYPNLEEVDLKRMMLEEKKRQDLWCLDTEYLRGSLHYDRYKEQREVLIANYDKVLALHECQETAEDFIDG